MSGTDDIDAQGESGHPATCPWCGQSRVRGITPSPDGNRWYRCANCTTSFFIRLPPQSRMAPNSENRRPDTAG
jgi:transposase-like protein